MSKYPKGILRISAGFGGFFPPPNIGLNVRLLIEPTYL